MLQSFQNLSIAMDHRSTNKNQLKKKDRKLEGIEQHFIYLFKIKDRQFGKY